MRRLPAAGLALAFAFTLAHPWSGRTHEAWNELNVEAPGPDGTLAGTLIEAKDPAAPMVLIVPGSGPTDRDGNNPAGVRAATYRLLAHELAGLGMASVRVDKRGMFGSAGAVADPNDVTIAAYAQDVRSWVDTLRTETGRDCLWLLGHSEGGLVAMAAAVESAEGVCGLLLAATPGRPLGAILREQLHANPANAPLLPDAERIIAELEVGHRVPAEAVPAPLLPLFAPQVQGFVIDLMATDPARLAGKVRLPILLIYGGSDLQVPSSDGELLAFAAPHAELVVLPGVTHVLKAVVGDDRTDNIATYADPALPLAEGIAARIARFLSANRR